MVIAGTIAGAPSVALSHRADAAPGAADPQDVFTPSGPEGYAPSDGSFLWDSWVLKRPDGAYTLFHLTAPANPDPNARHDQAQIRTAVSKDLHSWVDTGVALPAGPEGAWDDGPIWTGSTLYENGTYYLFYTGRNRRDGQTQRIGLATSHDGVNWDRPEKPLLEADSRWYETDEASPVYRAWRDPYVIKDPESGKYCMFFTAKTKEGDPTFRGCIGMATAEALEGPWEVQPPVLAPESYAQMECPQVIERDGTWYLFFSSAASDYDPDWAAAVGGAQTGLHCFVADSLTGPYEPLKGHGIVSGTDSNLYATRLLPDPDRPGEHLALGWFMEDRQVDRQGALVEQARFTAGQAAAAAVPGPVGAAVRLTEKAFTLSEPYPVVWDGDSVRIETGKKPAA